MTTHSTEDVGKRLLAYLANGTHGSNAELGTLISDAVCKPCRDGVPLQGEWHEVAFTNPDETAKAYCLATPIRALPQGKE